MRQGQAVCTESLNQGEQIKIDYAADEEVTEIRQVCMLEQPVCLVLISRMTLDLGMIF